MKYSIILILMIFLGACSNGITGAKNLSAPKEVDLSAWNLRGRVEFAHALMARSDEMCADYLSTVNASRSAAVSILDFVGLTFSSVAGLEPLNVAEWSAASTIAQGGSKTLEERYAIGDQYGIVYNSVMLAREQRRKFIIEFMNEADNDFDAWSPTSVFSFIEGNYHATCSVSFGLSRVSLTTEPQEAENLLEGADGG